MKILVTGGAGFIGSAVIRHLLAATDHAVVNVDKLTYAADLRSLDAAETTGRYRFERIDICDAAAIPAVLQRHQPDAIMHLAAEMPCRPLDRRAGRLHPHQYPRHLHAARGGAGLLARPGRRQGRGVPLPPCLDRRGLRRARRCRPVHRGDAVRSEFALFGVSKASSDHLVRAWHQTYGLPTVVSNCSNNYGPYQFPEKLIPLTILNAWPGSRCRSTARGSNVRDWLFVEDHAAALAAVLTRGAVGESYNIGGNASATNIAGGRSRSAR